MYEFDVENFTRYVVNILKELGEITLNNPDSEEKFPLAVVSNIMQSVRKTENNIPVYKRFSVNIEWWADSKYDVMILYEKTNKLLRNYNFSLVGSPTDMYDEVTKKHRYGGRYEVNYNGLINSFERII